MSPRCLWDRGKEVSSEGLAELIRSAGERGVNMAFLIGGPFGHSEAVHQRANASIRLSKMVLNHDVARIVLVEQLYRAWTILKGEPYHH
mmetsp:Transcript_4901/g.17786  ORF Transcript_4901/g.17786 Transcript_4901/m.17786 type:complete len:89 (+) Transcript_4901:803-1069(+)